MTRTTERSSRDTGPAARPLPSTWRERAFVLGVLAVALPVTAVLLVLGAGGEAIGFVWLVAVVWTALAGLAAALWSGLVHGDWSAFRGGSGRGHGCLRHECPRHAFPPDTRAEGFDWDTRTGAFAYMRIHDDRERLLDDDRLRDRDPGL